ncbi:PAS domain S-box-containing protein/diguanylate cyclase (GGDEF) domain-containing protein [Nitrosomonas nitrosa]|uniref:PAS domain S-box-containing protein/diguanylate cyclase (GGDEF) domain-containing protein n=1 Tax=Nitrosomonas nitrosa TaxID=52442 RepID=A0A1I4PJC6_9PROT|nr:EAL domain-containing protein [Nitrosomonas nitrosa]SFM27902.1 PAS domain S-box-containing protein/diguanylate cyclase (GGDEF) domain-containing protein [Nitrosomonas nitrosa]
MKSFSFTSFTLSRSLALRIFALATVYFLAGSFGLSMPYIGSNITLLWPPSGIALVVVLVWGAVCWPGIFLGSLLINLSAGALPLGAALTIAFGNTLAPVLGALILKKSISFDHIFTQGKDVVVFILVASCSMVLSATIGILSLYVSELLPGELILSAWLVWWLGDTIGVMIFAPPLLACASYQVTSGHRHVHRRFEFILVMGCCIAMTWLVFGDALSLGHLKLSLAFLVFPPLIWAGLRFDVLGASIAALSITLLAVWGTSQNLGPFARSNFHIDQLTLSLFIATTVLISYMMIGIQAGRRLAIQNLCDSESRLRMALIASNQGFFDLNVQTGSTTVSPEYAQMLGYDPQTFEETHNRWRDRMHPEDREAVCRLYQDYLQGQCDDYRVEFRQLTQQGDWKWIFSTGKIVERDEHNHPLRMLGIHTDISDRKAKELALRKSEEALRRAQSLAKLGSWHLDLKNNVLTWSEETFQIFGFKECTPLDYAHFLTYVVPEDRSLVENAWQAALRGEPYDIEHRIHISGKIKWVKEQAEVTFDNSGKPIEALGTVQDISERKFAEEAIKHAKSLLRTVIDATPDWIFVKDKLHRFMLVNQALANSQGIDPEGMIGKPDSDFWPQHLCVGDPAQGIKGFHADDNEALSGKTIHNPADPATLANGQLRWFDTLKLPLRDTSGEIIGVLGYARDVTDRMQVESKYRTLIEQIPAVTYIVDINPIAHIFYVSPQIETQFGFSVQEWLNDPHLWVKQIHDDDRERIFDSFSASLATGESYNREYRMIKKDGTVAWVRDEATWLKDSAGKPILLQGVVFDITMQRQAEEKLNSVIEELRISEKHQRELRTFAEREQSRMSALLSAMNIGILFEDEKQCIEYLNPAFLRMWGISERENLLNLSTRTLLEHATKHYVQPPHAASYVLAELDAHEISERFEIELNDGRILTQLSYPVYDIKNRAIGRLWIYEDVTQERQTAQQLIYLAERDPLTGLYNRHRFQEELDDLIAVSLRNQSKFALLYFDLDDFKYINDTFGHRAGDTVLVRTAGEISTIVRQIDIFARLGGDEFAILSQLQPKDDITALPARIVGTVASIPMRFRETNLRLTSSVGVAVFPEHGETAEDLIAHADAAMYQAKNKGKNTWAVYDPTRDASEAMVHRMTWYNRIAQALEQDLFEIHFQGVYETNQGSLAHLEALVRMRDLDAPDNLIMPGQFIPIAEKNGQIVNIDRWVIKQCILLLSQRTDMPSIAINISGRTFDDPAIPHYIRGLLTEFKVDPRRLIIELTETAAVSDIQDAQRFIEAVHQAGCRVCLDDFGSGFSTFSYLKYLGVEILKIDGSFIHDLPSNRDNQLFVKAMVEVARGLGKATVAEFVEDAATMKMIKSLGVNLAQGYYLGRPGAAIPCSS